MHKISVIIPVYKAEKYLRRCISSVLAQTHTNFELILVNDGSPDNSGEICAEYKSLDNRVIVVNQENQGVSAARNAGLDICTGEYICFIDSDDYVHPELLAFLLRLCEENQAPMSMCGFEQRACDQTGANAPLSEKPVEIINAYTLIERLCTKLQVHYVVPWAKLYRKEVFKNVKYPPEAFNEDDCVIHTLALNAEKIAVCYEQLYYYCFNPSGLTNSGVPVKAWINSFKYKENRMQILNSNGMYALLYEVQRLFFFDLLLQTAIIPNSGENKAYKKFLMAYIKNLFSQINQNPSASKAELLKMRALLFLPFAVKKYKHEDFLR